MKFHLFYISNLISFTNQKNWIKLKGIPSENCIFYSPRFDIKPDQLPSGSKLIKLDNILPYLGIVPYLNVFIQHKIILKNFITELLKATDNHDFIFYLPHFINYREQVIGFHKSCKGYFFIEEGLPAYRSDFGNYNTLDNPSWWFKIILSFLSVNIPNKIAPLFDESTKYLGAIGNFTKSFEKLKHRVVLPFRCELYPDQLDFMPAGSCLLAVDSVSKIPVSNETYRLCIGKTLEYINQRGFDAVYVKYHPDQMYDHKTRNFIKDLFQEKKVNYKELKNDFFIENYISHQPNVKIFGLLSSSLLYADFFGAEVFCFSETLKKLQNIDKSLLIMEELFHQKKLSSRFKFI